MKLIRWLLSNIILIAFVLALTYAYVYWDNLTGEDTPAGKVIAYLSVEYDEVREFLDSYDFDSGGTYGGNQTDAIESDAVAVAEVTETASVPQVMPPPVSQPRPPAQARPPVQAYPTAQARPPAQAYPTAQTRPPAQQPAPPMAVTQQPPARQPIDRPQVPPQAMIQAPPARQTMQQSRQPMPKPASPATATDKPASTTRELWIAAREEFHRGNIDGSISNYQAVIANSSNNYDAYGELGNVYLSRGNYREAASAYYEAAAILVKLGEPHRARSLLPMLGRLDRSRAEELNQLINKPKS